MIWLCKIIRFCGLFVVRIVFVKKTSACVFVGDFFEFNVIVSNILKQIKIWKNKSKQSLTRKNILKLKFNKKKRTSNNKVREYSPNWGNAWSAGVASLSKKIIGRNLFVIGFVWNVFFFRISCLVWFGNHNVDNWKWW